MAVVEMMEVRVEVVDVMSSVVAVLVVEMTAVVGAIFEVALVVEGDDKVVEVKEDDAEYCPELISFNSFVATAGSPKLLTGDRNESTPSGGLVEVGTAVATGRGMGVVK